VALGALAACAVAAGAAVQSRPDGPPGTGAAPARDADSVLARSSAWTREATPVLASIETELRRADEVRARWDGSSLAHRGPSSPPGAVVALTDRRAELAHHRDGLRAALATVRSAPGSEAALVVAWPRLRAAQGLLRSLSAARGELGDPVEAAVLRLVADEQAPDPAGGEPARGSRTGVDAVRVALASTASTIERPLPSNESAVSTVSTVSALPTAPTVSPSSSDVPETVAPTSPSEVTEVTDDAPEEAAPRRAVVDGGSPEPTMLSFDRTPSDPTAPTEEPQEPQEPEPADAGSTDAGSTDAGSTDPGPTERTDLATDLATGLATDVESGPESSSSG
jgi:hypothetical protein